MFQYRDSGLAMSIRIRNQLEIKTNATKFLFEITKQLPLKENNLG